MCPAARCDALTTSSKDKHDNDTFLLRALLLVSLESAEWAGRIERGLYPQACHLLIGCQDLQAAILAYHHHIGLRLEKKDS